MHLCTVKTVIWQICSNRPGKKVPRSARLSAGGGCNRNLGNAQIEVEYFSVGLPLGKLIELGELDKKNKLDLLAEWDEFGELD